MLLIASAPLRPLWRFQLLTQLRIRGRIMNSYERVVAALERRQPDRVPYVESVIDQRLMQALLPGCDYFQFNEWLEMDSVGQNRSSWSRDNVEYIDKEKGLFRDKWGVIRAFGPESTPAP